MKRSIFFILALILSILNTAFSQEESAAGKRTMFAFQAYYNAGQPDSIYYLFSPATQTALPLDKTKAFLSQLQSNYGQIRQSTFLRYQGAFGLYKTELEKGTIQVSLAVDENNAITGLYAKPYDEPNPNTPSRNASKMQLPFKGEWTVFWGGDTKEQNYHVMAKMQKNAFDIIITNPNGKSYRTDGKTNEDYYAFGQDILAPCDAAVVFAVDGVKDNIPGVMNTMYVPGNTVLLKTQHNEYILLAHLKQASLKVKQGDVVRPGQLIGLCGNSGNSSEPHLHFHLQDMEDFSQATGIKCFFDILTLNGSPKSDYSPVKGDKIRRP